MPAGKSLPEDVVERVKRAVDESSEELVALLQELVRIPSENPVLAGIEPGGEAQVQDAIAPVLAALGCEIDRWDALPGRPDQVGVLRGTGGGPSLAINGHIDVVPAGDPDEWPHGPWSGAIADGAVWGRGAGDMKGGVAAMLHAARVIQNLGFTLKGDLFLEAVIDEETGGPGTRATIERGYRPDFAIVAESTNLTVMPVEGGLEWVRVSVTGRGAHAAGRYLHIHAGGQGRAVNAIDKAAKILAAVAALERDWGVHKRHPLLPAGITTISPGVIAGGVGRGPDGLPAGLTAVANIPDYCTIEFDLKYLPSERPEEVRAEFEQFIARVAQTDPWLREHPPLVEWGVRGVSFPPADTPADHPAIETLVGCIQSVAGPAEITGFTAVSDIAWFAGAGIPCAIFGPGRDTGAHTTQERIEIDQLIAGTQILALMMLTWCGYD